MNKNKGIRVCLLMYSSALSCSEFFVVAVFFLQEALDKKTHLVIEGNAFIIFFQADKITLNHF